MKKPKWNNKWQGLSDMHAAKNAAAKITTESTTMVPSGASAATITVPPKPHTLNRTREELMEEMWVFINSLKISTENRQQRYLQQLSSMQDDTNYPSPTYWEAAGFTFHEQPPSSSSTEELMASCAALKQGPLEVKGNLTPSILTGDQPTTPST